MHIRLLCDAYPYCILKNLSFRHKKKGNCHTDSILLTQNLNFEFLKSVIKKRLSVGSVIKEIAPRMALKTEILARNAQHFLDRDRMSRALPMPFSDNINSNSKTRHSG